MTKYLKSSVSIIITIAFIICATFVASSAGARLAVATDATTDCQAKQSINEPKNGENPPTEDQTTTSDATVKSTVQPATNIASADKANALADQNASSEGVDSTGEIIIGESDEQNDASSSADAGEQEPAGQVDSAHSENSSTSDVQAGSTKPATSDKCNNSANSSLLGEEAAKLPNAQQSISTAEASGANLPPTEFQGFRFPEGSIRALDHTELSGYYDSNHPEYGTTLTAKYDCNLYIKYVAPQIRGGYEYINDPKNDLKAELEDKFKLDDGTPFLDGNVDYSLLAEALKRVISMTYSAFNKSNPCGIAFSSIESGTSNSAVSVPETRTEPATVDLRGSSSDTPDADSSEIEILSDIFGHDMIKELFTYSRYFIEPGENDEGTTSPSIRSTVDITNIKNLQNKITEYINYMLDEKEIPQAKVATRDSSGAEGSEKKSDPLTQIILKKTTNIVFDIFLAGIISDLQKGASPSIRITTGSASDIDGQTTTLHYNSTFMLNKQPGDVSFDVNGYSYPMLCSLDYSAVDYDNPNSLFKDSIYFQQAKNFENITNDTECMSDYWLKRICTGPTGVCTLSEIDNLAEECPEILPSGYRYCGNKNGFDPTTGAEYIQVSRSIEPFCRTKGENSKAKVQTLGCQDGNIIKDEKSLSSRSGGIAPREVDAGFGGLLLGTTDLAKEAIKHKLTIFSNVTFKDIKRDYVCIINGVYQGAYDTPELCSAQGGSYDKVQDRPNNNQDNNEKDNSSVNSCSAATIANLIACANEQLGSGKSGEFTVDGKRYYRDQNGNILVWQNGRWTLASTGALDDAFLVFLFAVLMVALGSASLLMQIRRRFISQASA